MGASQAIALACKFFSFVSRNGLHILERPVHLKFSNITRLLILGKNIFVNYEKFLNYLSDFPAAEMFFFLVL